MSVSTRARSEISAGASHTDPTRSIDAARVTEFHENLVERLHSEISDTLEKIGEGDWSDEIQKKLDEAIAQYAKDFGYDLDEEGQPLTDEQAIREGRGSRDEDEGDDDDGEPSGETDEEREPATA